MATIILNNTRQHEITLNYRRKGKTPTQLIIPRAKKEKTGDQLRSVHGTAPIDSEIIDDLRKNNDVVKYYFDKGWLVVQSKGEAATTKTASKPAAATGRNSRS